MLRAVWKMISLFLSVGSFLAVGVISLMANEDLIWVVGKAFVAFLGSWIVFSNLGNMLVLLLEKQDQASGQEPAGEIEKG